MTGNTMSVTTAGANTICGNTSSNTAINTWAFSTADADGNTLQNGQSITVTLVIDATTASTYGDGCTVDGNKRCQWCTVVWWFTTFSYIKH